MGGVLLLSKELDMRKPKQKKAPSQIVGDAVRELSATPSKDWLAGYDAGYSDTVAVIDDLVKLQRHSSKRCDEARKQMEDASRTLAYLDEDICKFTNFVDMKSIISDDIEG